MTKISIFFAKIGLTEIKKLPSSWPDFSPMDTWMLAENVDTKDKVEKWYCLFISGGPKSGYIHRYELSEKSKNMNVHILDDLLVGWLFRFYGISTFVGYLTPN